MPFVESLRHSPFYGWESRITLFYLELHEEEGLAGGKAASLGWRGALVGALEKEEAAVPTARSYRAGTLIVSPRKAQGRSESASVLHRGNPSHCWSFKGGKNCRDSARGTFIE